MSETTHVPITPSQPAPTEQTAEVEGLRLWLTAAVTLERGGGSARPVWKLAGRASVELAAVAAWVPDDAFGRAQLTGPRSFEIAVREPSEQSSLASGMPLFLTVTPAAEPASGSATEPASGQAPGRAEAAIWLAPWLAAVGGEGPGQRSEGPGQRSEAGVELSGAVAAVWVAGGRDDEGRRLGEVEYRGEAAAPPGWQLELTASPQPPPRALLVDGERPRLRLSWTTAALLAALAAPAPQLTLRASRSSDGEGAEAGVEGSSGEASCEPADADADADADPDADPDPDADADADPDADANPVERTCAAAVTMRVVRLGLTRGDPREVWPTSCDPSVRACLAALPSAESDTAACGSYRQVLACARSVDWPAAAE